MAMANATDRSNGASSLADVQFTHGMTLAAIERLVILETLRRQNANRTRAARVLGIGIRTLQRKLKQYQEEIGGEVVRLAREDG